MKRGLLKRLVSGAAATVMCLTGLMSLSASAEQTFYNNTTGTEDGYEYELWKDTGNTRMTITGGGSFSCEWSNINNCLFRKGRKFDCTQTYQQIGEMAIDYAVDFKPNGNAYMCVYGWTRNPLVEYYIVESWGDWRPPGNASALGTVNTDGGTYDIYKTTRYNQPSIDGDTTFDQYWSVRRSKPQGNGTYIEGTISVSNHFRAWECVGLRMGKMYEVALNIEGYQSSGSATVYGNTLRIGSNAGSGNSGGTGNSGGSSGSSSYDPGNGSLFTSTFENGTDWWSGRGNASVSSSSARAYSGSKSLYVSGRTDTWNGAAIELDANTFKAGSSYSFGAMVYQNSGSATTMQISMQYTQNGSEKYASVASANAANGQWTKLENTNFTIPAGASKCILYVEAPNSRTDFYIDQAFGGTAGSTSGNTGNGNNGNTGNSGGIDPSKPMVAISFDDGASATSRSDPAYRIIDALANNGFHATFFYVGDWIKTAEQVQYAYSKGMEIANHTTSHQNLTQLSGNQIRSEYDNTYNKLKNIIGAEPSRLMRLPYLASNQNVQQTLYDVPMITCSIDTQDWNGASSSQIIQTIQNAAYNGSLDGAIVLCHENYASTAEAMEYVLPWLKQQGYQVVTVSEMFAAKGRTLQGGQIYTRAG